MSRSEAGSGYHAATLPLHGCSGVRKGGGVKKGTFFWWQTFAFATLQLWGLPTLPSKLAQHACLQCCRAPQHACTASMSISGAA